MKKYRIPIIIVICILVFVSIFAFNKYNKIKYNSKTLGITLSFPASFKDKYTIKEINDSLSVYFKPEDSSSPKTGLLFTIIKADSKDLNPDSYDNILKDKFITINNQKYLVGSTTDVGFPDDNKEFKTYQKMKNQCKSIIESIK